jgi:glutamate-ammonia-ligase adenylyltransferase
LLVDAAGRSAFVADALQRSPELLHWLVKEIDRPPPDTADLSDEAETAVAPKADAEAQEAALARLQRRELLRIAVRDVLGRESLESVSAQLTAVADTALSHALRLATLRATEEAGGGLPGRIAVLALGRLGASELDYAPDVELVFVYEPDAEDDLTAHRVLRGVASHVLDLLARAAAGGDLYRLDLPVPAAALTGAPAASLRRWQGYCAGLNDHRLRLAFVRARAIAGDRELRARALETFTGYAYEGGAADGPLVDLRRRLASGETAFDDDVRNGVGGIADVEAFTATLRLAIGREKSGVRVAGTLDAIGALAAARVLTDMEGARLATAFAALRRVEQRLSLARGDVPPTLDEPGALDLAAAAFEVNTSEALRERLYAERLTVRAICREVLARI